MDEEGKPINPHIPQFMASAPWYLNAEQPSLKHQKNWKGDSVDDNAWYDRGAKVFQATKYRKGACAKYVWFYLFVFVNSQCNCFNLDFMSLIIMVKCLQLWCNDTQDKGLHGQT